MANEKNLIPNSERTPKDRQERASKMGRASGASRRRKKTLLQIMDMVERCPLNEIGKADLKRGGLDLSDLDPDDLTAMDGAVAGMYIAARRGNHKAFEQLARYKAQQQKDKLEIEKLKAEVRTLKAMLEPPENRQDDGFIAALADNSDWEDYEQEAADAEDQPDAEADGGSV